MRLGTTRGLKMKYGIFAAPAIIAMLSACTTVQTQSAANTASDTVVVADEEATVNTEGAVAENGADMDRIICKRSIPTGTRFARKECRSAREWREMREAVRSIMDEGSRRTLQTDVPGSG